MIQLLAGMLNVFVRIWERQMVLVESVMGYWVDLDAAEPLTPEGSAFVDQLAATGIAIAEFLARVAAELKNYM